MHILKSLILKCDSIKHGLNPIVCAELMLQSGCVPVAERMTSLEKIWGFCPPFLTASLLPQHFAPPPTANSLSSVPKPHPLVQAPPIGHVTLRPVPAYPWESANGGASSTGSGQWAPAMFHPPRCARIVPERGGNSWITLNCKQAPAEAEVGKFDKVDRGKATMEKNRGGNRKPPVLNEYWE